MSDPLFAELLDEFVLESRERADSVEQALLAIPAAEVSERGELLAQIRRELHTLKGNAAMMGLEALRAHAHMIEDEIMNVDAGRAGIAELLRGMDHLRTLLDTVASTGSDTVLDNGEKAVEALASETKQSIRIPFQSLDHLLELVGESVTTRNRLAEAVRRGPQAIPASSGWEQVAGAYLAVEKTLTALEEQVTRLRMVPLRGFLGQLRRIVHDEAAVAHKQVGFDSVGGETPIDKALVEVAIDALGHLVRNAVIHGIEPAERRVAAGKPPEGRIQLTARVHSSEIHIELRDDGGGIDKNELLRVARTRGVDISGIDDPLRILFLPGFSTRLEADISSGRGIGLSAVLEAVNSAGGEIDVYSQPGAGSLFRLRLPLSVSIIRALLVGSDEEVYAFPLASVVESLVLKESDGHEINNAGVLRWRDRLVTLLDIGHSFGTAERPRRQGSVVVAEVDGQMRGFVFDVLKGITQIVVKGLDPVFGSPDGLAGSTILADGRAVLILDPRGLMKLRPFVRLAHG